MPDERASEQLVQAALNALQVKRQQAADEVSGSAASIAQAFSAFEDAYHQRPTVRALQAIAALRVQLGDGFVPKTQADVEAIRSVYSQCLRAVSMNSVMANSGRELGPGANSPTFQKAFSRGDVETAQLHSVDSLRSAMGALQLFTDEQQEVLTIERSLDKGDFATATSTMSELGKKARPDQAEVAAYLKSSDLLKTDLETSAKVEGVPHDPVTSPIQGVHTVESLEKLNARVVIRERLLRQFDFHTLVRLPTGIFYKPGVKANVLFFDKRPPRADNVPNTKALWIYDFRTNRHFTLRKNTLKPSDLDDFRVCYAPGKRNERVESDRFKCFTADDLLKRDKINLDITWLKDDSLDDLDSLPAPDVIAAEIVENLQAALEQFQSVAEMLAAPR